MSGASEAGVRVTLAELLALRLPFTRGAPERRAVHGVASGESRSRERGRGIEFDELRPYQAGDDVRSIDWRTFARRNRPFTKRFSEERERTRFVVVDQRASMFFGTRETFKSVVAARTAARACWAALARGERVGGLVAGERIVGVRARRTRQAVLELLGAVVEANRALSARAPDGVAFERVLDDCLALAPPGATLVLVSDFADHGARSAPTLAALGRRHALSLVRISDPLEEALDVHATVGVSDGRTRRTVRLGRDLRRRHAAERAAHLRRLADDAAACGAALRHLSTDDDPLAVPDAARHARVPRA